MICKWCSLEYEIEESDAQIPDNFCGSDCEDEALAEGIDEIEEDYEDDLTEEEFSDREDDVSDHDHVDE